jgi:hypothetical protein
MVSLKDADLKHSSTELTIFRGARGARLAGIVASR